MLQKFGGTCFSILAMLQLGFSFRFESDVVKIHLGTIYYGRGFMSNGFMVLDIDYNNNDSGSFFLLSSVANDHNSSIKWHARLGHIGQDRMTRLVRDGLLSSLTKVDLPTCEHCLAGKATRKPFNKASRAEFS